MGKQTVPKNYRKKEDTGPSNARVAVKKEMGKKRFSIKKSVKSVNKVHKSAESSHSSGSMSKRTDLMGKRVTYVK